MRPEIGALAFVLLAAWAPPALAAGELTASEAVEALKRYVCFDAVWWGDPYFRLGQTATVDVRTQGPVAYIWSEDLRRVPHVLRWADSYVVVDRSAGPVVTQRSSYNIDLLKGETAFQRERQRVYGGPSQRLTLNLPADCTPKFDPDNAVKAQMKAVRVSSLTNALKTWGKRPVGGRVAVTIARFNVDYPETFALRSDTQEVLRIGLISGDPTSYTGGRYRQYLVVPALRGLEASRLRRLIQRYGETTVLSIR